MNAELLYTSAPQGLKQGSRGFCTVVSTVGMPLNLATKLESLSGYRHLFPSGTPAAEKNPVNYSHLRFSVGGRPVSVLSRIADYGLDYSQRTNKIAHHVVVDSPMPVCGPAALLRDSGVMRDGWDGVCANVPAPPILPAIDSPANPCVTWKRLTGDAGWGGVVASAWLASSPRPVFVIFSENQSPELLDLMVEALALLPAHKRWQATFSTYVTTLAPDVECRVRCVVAGSEEARMASARGSVIDLTNLMGMAPQSDAVVAAREGFTIGQPPEVVGSQGVGGAINAVEVPVISMQLPTASDRASIDGELVHPIAEAGTSELELDPANPFGQVASNQPPELRSGKRRGVPRIPAGGGKKRSNRAWKIVASIAALFFLASVVGTGYLISQNPAWMPWEGLQGEMRVADAGAVRKDGTVGEGGAEQNGLPLGDPGNAAGKNDKGSGQQEGGDSGPTQGVSTSANSDAPNQDCPNRNEGDDGNGEMPPSPPKAKIDASKLAITLVLDGFPELSTPVAVKGMKMKAEVKNMPGELVDASEQEFNEFLKICKWNWEAKVGEEWKSVDEMKEQTSTVPDALDGTELRLTITEGAAKSESGPVAIINKATSADFKVTIKATLFDDIECVMVVPGATKLTSEITVDPTRPPAAKEYLEAIANAAKETAKWESGTGMPVNVNEHMLLVDQGIEKIKASYTIGSQQESLKSEPIAVLQAIKGKVIVNGDGVNIELGQIEIGDEIAVKYGGFPLGEKLMLENLIAVGSSDQVANDLKVKVEDIDKCIKDVKDIKKFNSLTANLEKHFSKYGPAQNPQDVVIINDLVGCLKEFLPPRELNKIFKEGMKKHDSFTKVMSRITTAMSGRVLSDIYDGPVTAFPVTLGQIETAISSRYQLIGNDPQKDEKEKNAREETMLARSLIRMDHLRLRKNVANEIEVLRRFVAKFESLDLEALKKREFTIAKPINGIYLSPKKGSGKTGSQLFFPVVLTFEFQRLEGSSPPSSPEKTEKLPEASGLPSTGTAVTSGLK